MQLSQKCQYALRAVFELACQYRHGPVKIAHIARKQAIPLRFLEQILAQLRQGGFAESRRGRAGGYLLARRPEEISVGRLIRFIDGPLGPVSCTQGALECPLGPGCVFLPLWTRAQRAQAQVYDSTTFQDLVEEQEHMRAAAVLDYQI